MAIAALWRKIAVQAAQALIAANDAARRCGGTAVRRSGSAAVQWGKERALRGFSRKYFFTLEALISRIGQLLISSFSLLWSGCYGNGSSC